MLYSTKKRRVWLSKSTGTYGEGGMHLGILVLRVTAFRIVAGKVTLGPGFAWLRLTLCGSRRDGQVS